jgi:Domain of unknown function (DUF4276)
MGRLVVYVEEPSCEQVVIKLLPKINPFLKNKTTFDCIAFEGKQDLQKRFPKLLRADLNTYGNDVFFIILLDQDSNTDCKVLKGQLLEKAHEAGCPQEQLLVRIVCRELEAWYLGDLNAIDQAYSYSLSNWQENAKFRNPDRLNNAKEELQNVLKQRKVSYSPVSFAKAVAPFLSLENNKSGSFTCFVSGVQTLSDRFTG